MKKSSLFLLSFLALFSGNTHGLTALWQGSGRIIISSDGNEHDHDDWSAFLLSGLNK